MDLVRDILLVAHLLGLAAIMGPVLAQLRSSTKSITPVMVWGARAQIVTGVLLAGLVSMGDDANHWKIGTKLLLALAVAGVAESQARKAGSNARAYWIIGGLTLVVIAVAVIW